MKLANQILKLTYILGAVPAFTALTPSTVDVHSAGFPAQILTSTVNSTVTATSSTALSITSTVSSTSLTTLTSVITLSSTIMTLSSSGGMAIPGFPWEAIITGALLGIAVLGILKRK